MQLCSRDPVRAGLQLRAAGPASAPTANTCTTDGRCAAVVAASAEQAELLDATLRRLGLGTAGADLDASPPGWTPASGLPAARPSAGSSASDGGEGRGSGASRGVGAARGGSGGGAGRSSGVGGGGGGGESGRRYVGSAGGSGGGKGCSLGGGSASCGRGGSAAACSGAASIPRSASRGAKPASHSRGQGPAPPARPAWGAAARPNRPAPAGAARGKAACEVEALEVPGRDGTPHSLSHAYRTLP